MKINSFILSGFVLTACNCVSTVDDSIKSESTTNIVDSTTNNSSTSSFGVFTTTEDSSDSSNSTLDSSSTYFSDLNFAESSSSTGIAEPIPLCNNSEDGECKVFVSSVEKSPNLGVNGFDAFCTLSACGSNFVCPSFKAMIRTNLNFWEAFENFKGSYLLPSGKSVAVGTNSLEYANSINENEFGKVVPKKTPIWSGFSGMFYTCANGDIPWKSTHSDTFADIGYVGGVENTWFTGEQISCDNKAHVICVEIPVE